jgi:uncharacterized membrane protein YgcG
MRYRLTALLLLLSVIVFGATHSVQAADRSWDWTRWDVVISSIDTTRNTFHVTETHVIHVTSGTFNGGDRGVDLGRVTGIDKVKVTDGSTPLQLVNGSSADNCPTTRGIFCVFTANNERVIYYNFVAATSAGQTRTIRIEYDVHGALRSYPGGDQLWWSPLASRRDFYVYASTATVQMPANTPIDMLAAYGPWTHRQSGNNAIFELTGRLGLNEEAEIRVQYPHNGDMAPAAWQAGFDNQQALVEQLGPVISLGSIALTILLSIGGPLFVLIRYATHGRDPNPVVVPEYLTEPPSSDPPGIAGTLIDEKADMVDIMATLIDLARRGYIVIEQQESQGFFNRSPEFIFHRTEPTQNAADATLTAPMPLRSFERILINGIFEGVSTRKLSDLRNKFYTTIPTIKSNLYEEVVAANYFDKSPESTRSLWGFLGIAAIFGAGGLFFVALGSNSPLIKSFPTLPLPLFGLVVTGFAMIFMSRIMPAKTPLGSQEAAKWKAFRHYLANIKKYTDVTQAADQFEKYIGYAVAFGLDKAWIRTFSDALTSMPNWYYPTYLGGYWHGGYHSGVNRSGELFSGSSPNMSGSLNSVSNDMTQGLNAMSSGLTTLLNSASSTMNSQPSSSGSGGGSSGGGSSGGGSAGGH